MYATSNNGFPLLVIEYFRGDMEQHNILNKDKQLNIEKQEKLAGLVKTYYQEDTDSFSVSEMTISKEDNRVSKSRWKMVEWIAIVEASPQQTYFSSSLNHPHYSIHPMEYKSFRGHWISFCKNNKNKHPKRHFTIVMPNTTITSQVYYLFVTKWIQ
jgi:hypothetical protein